VENNLGDLWSLFDFINPGVLGTVSGFKRYIKEATALPQGYAQLRSVIRPYILRRLKTDTAIIQDLPQKVLFKAWATLSRSQVVLYQRLAGELYEAAQTPQGIQRSGLILAYLLKFKQLCNHPDQLSGGTDFDPAQSGKFARLAEICELIRDKRERVLVFTQFREMVEPLNRFLHTLFGHPGVTLHGGTGIAKRKEAVERFQSEREYVPYFVLSLKAGGVGLNLTAANHVVHFDRWWNPAVERQAEDRAFRIGQKRAVMVHQFICKGTIEERIDALISEKQQLAESIVGSDTQQLLTQMSTEQLREMVTLTLTGASG
jgi:non-specific serine/threonine protein kinase